MFVCLTEHGDVDAGRSRAAEDALEDVAGVASAVGHRGAREEEAGARARGGRDVRLRLDLDELQEKRKQQE